MYSLTIKRELGAAAGQKQGVGMDLACGPLFDTCELGSLQNHNPLDHQMYFWFLESFLTNVFPVFCIRKLVLSHSFHQSFVETRSNIFFLASFLPATFCKVPVLAECHDTAQTAKRKTTFSCHLSRGDGGRDRWDKPQEEGQKTPTVLVQSITKNKE